jgi:hypothetical protein
MSIIDAIKIRFDASSLDCAKQKLKADALDFESKFGDDLRIIFTSSQLSRGHVQGPTLSSVVQSGLASNLNISAFTSNKPHKIGQAMRWLIRDINDAPIFADSLAERMRETETVTHVIPLVPDKRYMQPDQYSEKCIERDSHVSRNASLTQRAIEALLEHTHEAIKVDQQEYGITDLENVANSAICGSRGGHSTQQMIDNFQSRLGAYSRLVANKKELLEHPFITHSRPLIEAMNAAQKPMTGPQRP